MPDLDPLTEIVNSLHTDSLVSKHAQRTGLDPELVRRVIGQESQGKPRAVSPKGAGGLMQLMPGTAQTLGVRNVFDPDENIRGGTDYLKQQLDKFGDVNLALAAYNAGPGAVIKYGNKVPPYAETQNYVKKIGGGYQGTGYAQDPLTEITSKAQTPSYDTSLTPAEERQFQQWKRQYAPRDSGADYDLRGAFKAGLTPDARTGHWPDTFKKPNHPTFSNQSKYAVGADAAKAGSWQGEQFTSPRGEVDPLTEITSQPELLTRPPITVPLGQLTADVNRWTRKLERQTKPRGWGKGPIGAGVNIPQQSIAGATVEGEAQRGPTAGESVRAAGRMAMRSAGLDVLPASIQDIAAEQVAKGTAGLARMASGLVKTLPRQAQLGIRAPAPVESATRAVREPLNVLAGTLEQGAGEMSQGRNPYAQAGLDVAGGAAASAPAMLLQGLGVPAPVAFGIDAYLKAEGRDADWEQVLKETGLGALSSALFEIPTPIKANLAGQILQKLAIVGIPTTAMELAAGKPLPQALTAGAIQGGFAATGARRGPKVEEALPMVPDALQGQIRASQPTPEDYINLHKLKISDEEKANLGNTVSQMVSEGRVSKEPVSFEQIKKEAAELDPALVRDLKPPKRGETLDPVVRFAARERLNTLNAEAVRLQKEIDSQRASGDPKEIDALQSRLAQTENDAKGILDVLIPTRSQDGRNLAYHRMMAEQSFDADYWLSRARRTAERSGVDVTGRDFQLKEKTIRTTIAEGSEWETRVKTLEQQVEALRAKLETADSGTKPDANKRAFRQKAESLQARLDARADAAKLKLQEFLDPNKLHDITDFVLAIPHLAEYGAAKLARKGISTAIFAEEMAAEFGDKIKPHLKEIYRQAYTIYQSESKRLGDEAKARSVSRGADLPEAEIKRLLAEKDKASAEVRQRKIQLAKTFSALEKTSMLETLSAIRKAGLLTGVKTHLRNVGGNTAYQAFDEVARMPAAITDMVVSAATGRRAISGSNPVAMAKSSYEAATKGVKEAIEVIKHGASADELAKLELHREVNSGWKVIDAYTNTVFRVLGAEDKVFRTYALKRSLEDQARVIALNEARTSKIKRGEVGQRTKELAQSPTADMASQAVLDAEVSTFNNQGTAASAISRAKRSIGSGGRFAMDLVVPFIRTPANVFARLIEATPAGLGKAAFHLGRGLANKNFGEAEQRAFSQTIGRSVTGTGLITLGYVLAKNGYATGLRDDEPGRNERDKAAGRSAISIRVGDAWHQVGAFSPLGNLLAIGATLQREESQAETKAKGTVGKLQAFGSSLPSVAGRTVLEQPMLQGVSSLTDALQDPGRFATRFTGGVAGSFIPTAVSDVGAALDPHRRESKTIKQMVQARVPLWRMQLPETIDVFGKPLEARRTAAVDPTLTSTAKETRDPLLKELVRLDAGVPKSAKKQEESDDGYRRRLIGQGQAMEKFGRMVIATRGYQALSDDDKREALKDAFEQAKREVSREEKRGQPREPRKRPLLRIPRLQVGSSVPPQ